MSYPDFNDLREVNEQVNRLGYTSDMEQYGKNDFWTSIVSTGDCEDSAITKYRRLFNLGWPLKDLRLACCYVETGEYHAVLIVSTDEGDVMLDNRQPHPVPVALVSLVLGYKPDIIQGSGQTWVEWKDG